MIKAIRKIIYTITYIKPINIVKQENYKKFICRKLYKNFTFHLQDEMLHFYIREYRFKINPNNNYYTFIELIKDMYV